MVPIRAILDNSWIYFDLYLYGGLGNTFLFKFFNIKNVVLM